MSRLYIQPPWPTSLCFHLEDQASHYLKQVLRKSPGDRVEVFDGQGQSVEAKVHYEGKKTITLHGDQAIQCAQPGKLKISLGLGLIKPQNMEYALQKAIELGANEITPILFDFCSFKHQPEALAKKHERWLSIIINSCQQCHQNFLPLLHPIATLQDWLHSTTTDLKLMFDPLGNFSFQHVAQSVASPPKTLALITGPEGGFSPNERDLLQKQHFQTIKLGPRVLKAETAPVVALALIQSFFGDF